MNFCLNHFGNKNIEIKKQGNFKIIRITRCKEKAKTEKKTAQMSQFKINPSELLGIKLENSVG